MHNRKKIDGKREKKKTEAFCNGKKIVALKTSKLPCSIAQYVEEWKVTLFYA